MTDMKKILPVLAFVLVLIFLYAPLRVSGEQKVSISGKFIRNSASGLPLNDIQVKVTGTKELIIRTDRSGNYIAYNLPAGGNYTVTPFKAGFLFAPESKTYTNLTASKINENFGVSERTYSISGKVIVGGKPSKGEIIMINTRAVKYFTNEDGEYFIDNLSYEGPYTVTVESNRVVFEPFKIDQLDKNVVYNFEKSIKAMGYVTSSGKGIAGVEIAVNNKRYKTDENGYYEINGLAANGSYILAVINSEMNPVPKFVELKKVTQDIDNVNFSLSGSISGTVKMSNKPFAGALIKVESSDQTEETKTDKNGAYKINKLGLHRDYAISVSSPGYMFSPKDRTVKKLANQTGGQNFTASVQKYKIYGVVTRGTAFVKDAEISIGGISKVVKTDAQGAYSFDGLTAGKNYSVSVKSKQIKFTESKKTVNGISGDTEINFDGLLSISGKVTIDGMPLENAKVLYDFNSFVLTDKNGNYTVDGLMPNQVYTIEVSSNDYKFTPSIFTSERLKECLTDEDFKVVIDYKLKEKEEKLAREEAAKKAKEEERLRKEELKRIEAEEKKALKEAKKKALEEEKARKEELAKAALQEKAAREEAAKQSQEEKKKQAVSVKEIKEPVINEDEIQIALLQEKLAAKESAKKAKEEERLRKEELKRIEAEERKAREEAKKKALEEEKARKEELAKAALQEKLALKEAEKKAKEEERLRKEESKRTEAEEKLAAKESAKKAKEEERLRKEELKRIEAEERKAREEAKKKALEEEKARKEELAKAALQEKLAREEAAKKAKEEERLRKEELKRIEAEERKAREEAKKKALEEEKARKEELAKAALQEKLAREEAAKKAKEEEKLKKEEQKKIELQEKINQEQKRRLEMQAQIALQEQLAQEEEAKKQELQNKLIQEQENKKRQEEERLKKEEEIRIAEQQLEQERLRREEQKKADLRDKLTKEQEKKQKQEEERLKKEEEKRIKEQQKEQEKLEKAAEKKRIAEEKLAAKEAAKKAKEEERLRKEELKRIEREEKESQKIRPKQDKKRESQPTPAAVAPATDKNAKLSIAGRVLKGRYGVARIQIKLLADGKTDTFLTDKYGYYLIPDLERDKDYVVTVVSDNNVLNISPKSRVYKKINGDFTNHNYYVVTEK